MEHLVFHFSISRGARNIRVLFQKDSMTWSAMKVLIASLVQMPVEDLEFENNSALQRLEDDGSTEFLNQLAHYSFSVYNHLYRLGVQRDLEARLGSVVHVRFTNGNEVAFRVNFETETVGDLKTLIDMKTGIVPFQQVLIHANKSLGDDKRLLRDIPGFEENPNILFIFRLLDGVVPDVSARDKCFENLSPTTVYDAIDSELVFTSKPFLFRSQTNHKKSVTY